MTNNNYRVVSVLGLVDTRLSLELIILVEHIKSEDQIPISDWGSDSRGLRLIYGSTWHPQANHMHKLRPTV